MGGGGPQHYGSRGRSGLQVLILARGRPAPGPRLQARPSVGTGRLGRTGRPSRRARNGAEARTCRAMPRHSVVERSRIAFSMKIFLPPSATVELQKSEREKTHCGKTNQHAPTQTPCNQPAIAVLTHARTQQTHPTTSTATKSAPYTCPIMTSALALQSQRQRASVRVPPWCSLHVHMSSRVLHGQDRISPATPRNQNNVQPSRGQPQDAVGT